MKYLTIQQVRFSGPGHELQDHLHALMESLRQIEAGDAAIGEPDLAAELPSGQVDVQMVVDSSDPAQAMVKALATLRAAIGARGDGTPGWDTTSAVMHAAPADAAHLLLAST